jgi:hypothetical protein
MLERMAAEESQARTASYWEDCYRENQPRREEVRQAAWEARSGEMKAQVDDWRGGRSGG